MAKIQNTETGRASLAEQASDLVSAAELESLTKLKQSFWYFLAASGRIPSLKLGGENGRYVRFVKSEVLAWLEAQRRPAAKL